MDNISFSSIVKNELCRVDKNEKSCMLSELLAVVRLNGTMRLSSNRLNIKISTENAAFARRIFSSVKELYNTYPEVSIRKSTRLKKHVTYILVISAFINSEQIPENIGHLLKYGNSINSEEALFGRGGIFNRSCCVKAYLRGAFLAGGSMSDPEKTYHLEISNGSYELALELKKIMETFNLKGKIIKRKGNYITYLKEGENIVDFLNIMGAHSALLELENIRILKGMRNNVNRIVNCETANLEKTVNASLRQVENIKYIKDNLGLDILPKTLREIAEVRLNCPDASLKELGEMLNPILSKSGVNHRLRKLDQIAENKKYL